MFLITEYYNNGYGCSCCKDEWENHFWSEEMPKLTIVSNIIKFGDSYQDGNTIGIKIEDGSNGKVLFHVQYDLARAKATLYIYENEKRHFIDKQVAIDTYKVALDNLERI